MSAVRWLVAAGLAAGVGVATAQAPGAPDAARRRAAELERQIRAAGEEARQLDGRLAALRAELEKLREQVAKLPAGPPDGKKAAKTPLLVEVRTQPAAAPEKAGATEVDFRLARSRRSAKKTNVGVVLQGGKVYLVEFESIGAAFKEARQANPALLDAGGVVTATRGDFDLKVTPVGTQFVRLELVLRPGRPGETLALAKAAGSAFRTRLEALDRDDNVLQFCVYPDGFEAFRELRAVAWGLKFDDVGWVPFAVGDTIPIGDGPATIQ